MTTAHEVISETKAGPWSLQQVRVNRPDQRMRWAPAGEYEALVHEVDGVVMSDTPAEWYEHRRAIDGVHGRVLTAGLGIGLFVGAAIQSPAVESIHVVEKSPDVIRLVGARFDAVEGVTIEQGDAFEYSPLAQTVGDYSISDSMPPVLAPSASILRTGKASSLRQVSRRFDSAFVDLSAMGADVVDRLLARWLQFIPAGSLWFWPGHRAEDLL